jgi:hypothetical protein
MFALKKVRPPASSPLFRKLTHVQDGLWKTVSHSTSSGNHGHVYPPPNQVPCVVNTSSGVNPLGPIPSKDQYPWTCYDSHTERWDIDALRSQEQVTPLNDGVGYEAEYTWLDEATLSEEQQTVISHVRDGYNIFVSGSAGTYACLAVRSRFVLLTRRLRHGEVVSHPCHRSSYEENRCTPHIQDRDHGRGLASHRWSDHPFMVWHWSCRGQSRGNHHICVHRCVRE